MKKKDHATSQREVWSALFTRDASDFSIENI